MSRVLLAMSGGVDSSVAALLLQRQGFELVGCTMQLWDHRRNGISGDGAPRTGRCCSLDDAYDARRVAERLGFPFYVLNLEKEFEQKVVQRFIGEYLTGSTPIPCTACNTFLKFDRLAEFGSQVGISRVATGHYARVERDEKGRYQLLRGVDRSKDQSYYLFELTQRQLSRILFPVGSYAKSGVRELAAEADLMTARKPESQEICFVPDGDYATFINRHAGEVDSAFLPVLEERNRPGPVLFRDGTRLGTHDGIYRFTVGQRKGLGIAHHRPLYVLGTDPQSNTVIVGYKEDVYSESCVVRRVNWIEGGSPELPLRAEVKVRSNHTAAPAAVCETDDRSCGEEVEIRFDEPQLAVTPGQAAVFYSGARVLGGGWIGRAPEAHV